MTDHRREVEPGIARGRTLVVGFIAHACLLVALLVGMTSLLVSEGGAGMHTSGPLIVGAYVAATVVVTGAMVWHMSRRR